MNESLLDLAPGRRLLMSWKAFDAYVNRIAASIRTNHAVSQISGVYGFPRGGLVLAVKLSYLLDLPLLMAPAKNCIVCDDISDTGDTLLKYQKSPDYITATLIVRDGTKAIPAYYGEFLQNEHWLVFPWEEAEVKGYV